MKISNSKKELARIISENGGWREEAESAAQCVGGEVSFWHDTATKQRGEDWCGRYLGACDDIRFTGVKLPNWHQTILSREEYFHLYPAPDADGWIEWRGGECPVDKYARIDIRMTGGKTYYDTDTHWGWNADSFKITHYRLHKPEQAKPELCESVVRSIPEPDEQVWTNPPSIEQLASDYHNAKGFAERKQREADDAKAVVEAKLKALELAGEAIGLLLSPINAKKEPELVIAVQAGGEVECVESNIKRDKYNGMVGRLRTIDESDTSTPYLVDFGGEEKIWCHKVKFIRRP